jgi:hypothetical protein
MNDISFEDSERTLEPFYAFKAFFIITLFLCTSAFVSFDSCFCFSFGD